MTLVRDHPGAPVGPDAVHGRGATATGSNPLEGAPSEQEIRNGIDDDQFVVYYQPVVDLVDGRIVKFEALVRWNHPQRGLLNPSAFIGVAEASDLIIEIGTLVLEEACRQTAEWQCAGADITLAVNISARELADPAIVERVRTTLAAAGMDPHSLWLEVTETALVEDLDQVTLRLGRLSGSGIGIAIDDFGTGWASLLYLRQFPVRELKIDRVFVSGVDNQASDAAITRSVLSLGGELDLFVTAEGVETEAQAERLRKLGCRFGQGYLYGRPTPASTAPIERSVDVACRSQVADT